MRPSEILFQQSEAIRRVVFAHGLSAPRVFGSVAAGTDVDGSDLDLLVEPSAATTLMDIGRVRHALNELLGIRVDVLTPRALPESFRAEVLRLARPL